MVLPPRFFAPFLVLGACLPWTFFSRRLLLLKADPTHSPTLSYFSRLLNLYEVYRPHSLFLQRLFSPAHCMEGRPMCPPHLILASPMWSGNIDTWREPHLIGVCELYHFSPFTSSPTVVSLISSNSRFAFHEIFVPPSPFLLPIRGRFVPR